VEDYLKLKIACSAEKIMLVKQLTQPSIGNEFYPAFSPHSRASTRTCMLGIRIATEKDGLLYEFRGLHLALVL
jgi:hypothetical protein